MYLLIHLSQLSCKVFQTHLHPTMYLLIPCQTYVCNNLKYNLHPTMYLLIPRTSVAKEEVFTFTSHYVSINSLWRKCSHYTDSNLHPTMYLLIHTSISCDCKTEEDLHPTMYLLILTSPAKL